MKKRDLLIYTTVANVDNNIKYSVLISPETGRAAFPSIVIEKDGKEIWFVDNNLYMIRELLPALKAFMEICMNDEQSKTILDIPFPDLKPVSIAEMIDILEYAIERDLLNETM